MSSQILKNKKNHKHNHHKKINLNSSSSNFSFPNIVSYKGITGYTGSILITNLNKYNYSNAITINTAPYNLFC